MTEAENTCICPQLVKGGIPAELCRLTGAGDERQRIAQCPANRGRQRSKLLVRDCHDISPSALAVLRMTPEWRQRGEKHQKR